MLLGSVRDKEREGAAKADEEEVMTDEIVFYKPWFYPSPDVAHEQACVILGEPLANYLRDSKPELPAGQWVLMETAADSIYEEKP